MLISLYIKNFGLIESEAIEFGAGLNVLTGETGAGKSIVLEALRVALGLRVQDEMIRTGKDKSLLQAVFDISQLPEVAELIESGGGELDEQDSHILILSREINRQGRNTCRVNDRLVTLNAYREIGAYLADLHGQHDQFSLLNPVKQLQLLDRYGGPVLQGFLQDTESAYREWRKNSRVKESMSGSSRERLQRLDALEYACKEIDAANLAEEDENELLARRDMLANAERIALLTNQALVLLHNGEETFPAVDLIGQAQNNIDELSLLVPGLKEAKENMFTVFCLLEDIVRDLAICRDNVESDPRELDYLEERLLTIKQLKKKYGPELTDILAYRRQLGIEQEELLAMETDVAGIDALLAESFAKYNSLAGELQNLRLEVAGKLQSAIEREIQDLGMTGARFEVLVKDAELSRHGKNTVEFYISPNPGEPLRPLAKSASGGEISRVMLALKSVLAAADEINTMVFDEVDAGVGGLTLQSVAEKLQYLSQTKQVLCVTHAAGIAACAEKHYLVQKTDDGIRTQTTLTLLTEEKRLEELKRMLGGDQELIRSMLNILPPD